MLDCTTPECLALLGLDKESARSLMVQFLSQIAQGAAPAAQGIQITESVVSAPTATADVPILAANPNRRVGWLQNIGSVSLFVSHSGSISALDTGILVPANGGVYVFGTGDWHTTQSIVGYHEQGSNLRVLVAEGVIAP